MTRPRFAPAIAIALLTGSLALTACDRGNVTGDAVSARPLATREAAPLEDGEHFAFVRRLDGDLLVVDPAEFLSGEAAAAAARADGVIGSGETLPNDFYIRDVSHDEVSVTLASDAEVVLLVNREGIEEVMVPLAELRALFAGETSPDAYYGYVPGTLPALLVIEQGVVTRVAQHYLP